MVYGVIQPGAVDGVEAVIDRDGRAQPDSGDAIPGRRLLNGRLDLLEERLSEALLASQSGPALVAPGTSATAVLPVVRFTARRAAGHAHPARSASGSAQTP